MNLRLTLLQALYLELRVELLQLYALQVTLSIFELLPKLLFVLLRCFNEF
jgi:hypothetical protein